MDIATMEILASFVKCTRHVCNFPHPELSLGQLRSEAVIAEQLLQRSISEEEWDKINEIAFSE